jgi:hypothetical protein
LPTSAKKNFLPPLRVPSAAVRGPFGSHRNVLDVEQREALWPPAAQVRVRALAGDLDPADVQLEPDVPRVGLLEQDVVQRPAVHLPELAVVVVKVEIAEPVADSVLAPLLRSDFDVRAVATMLLAAMDGIQLRYLLTPEDMRIDETFAALAGQTLADLACDTPHAAETIAAWRRRHTPV